MPALLITFADKVQGQALPNPINELMRYLDANEIKNVANNHAGLIDANTALFADYTPLTRIDDDSTTTGLYTAAKLIALLATKADVGSTSTAGKDEYIPNTAYVVADGILFVIVDEETRFYQVLQNFTASNTGDLEGDLVIDEGAGNIQREELRGVVLPDYQAGLFTDGAMTFYNNKIYRTPSETPDSPADGSPWVVVGFSDALTENYIWIGGSSGVATAIESKKLYPRTLGDVLLSETYMIDNYSTDKLGQKTISDYHVAEKTPTGWSIIAISPTMPIKVNLDVTDTDYYDSGVLDLSEFENADIIVLTGNVSPTSYDIDEITGVVDGTVFTLLADENEQATIVEGGLGVDEILVEGGASIELTYRDQMQFIREGTLNKNTNTSTY